MYLLLCVMFLPQSPLQSKKERGRTHANKLEKILQDLLEIHGEGWTEELRGDLPRSFQRHGDLVLLGDNCFSLPRWKKIGTAVKLFQTPTFLFFFSTKCIKWQHLLIAFYFFRSSTAMECSGQRTGGKAPGNYESNIQGRIQVPSGDDVVRRAQLGQTCGQ